MTYIDYMNKKILIILSTLILMSIYFLSIDRNTPVTIIYENDSNQEIIVRGIFEEEGDTSCYYDGVCSIIMGKYEVITFVGWPSEIKGDIDNSFQIGNIIEVYGKIVDKNIITLYGNESYYLKVLQK